LYSEPVPKQNWKITNETKEIAGYKCQKATCTFRGRHYIAWFTREIPVKEGPWKFNGLPGLIVKIYDTHEHYDFELYSVKKEKKTIVFNDFGELDGVEYYEVSRKAYINMSRNRLKAPFAGQDITFTRDGTPFTPQARRYDVIERDIK
jgi:GLPGLI family protein